MFWHLLGQFGRFVPELRDGKENLLAKIGRSLGLDFLIEGRVRNVVPFLGFWALPSFRDEPFGSLPDSILTISARGANGDYRKVVELGGRLALWLLIAHCDIFEIFTDVPCGAWDFRPYPESECSHFTRFPWGARIGSIHSSGTQSFRGFQQFGGLAEGRRPFY